MQKTLKYGNSKIAYVVIQNERQKLTIEVHPNLEVIAIAPTKATENEIEEGVASKSKWILKQFKYFESFLPRTPVREYVAGETHLYLGKRYLLLIKIESSENTVKLKSGNLVVYTTHSKANKEQARLLLSKWYYENAIRVFDKRWNIIKAQFSETEDTNYVIRRMKKRWGSHSKNGLITLNPELIKASTKCIDYVIIHELCHTLQPNHSAKFYKLLSKKMPDWERWKNKLENFMS